ncbi:hypothetical protein IVA95_27815 [Bradyrhizobium sp. 157]|uniref:hypothetical protein n=1 Tax=Bradyrhizobium sp. 157 TaxID=2782631 RepID=UPI001FFBC351|nr:hypothetical protein [Bradyrhizobium sp. 157]MCK1641286.1 hypothetical protein [Bradyrhizobium sp. 157]
MRIYSWPVFAVVQKYSISKLGPIGEIMEAERHSSDAQQGVARRVIEQKLEDLYARRTGALPAVLCGEGAP